MPLNDLKLKKILVITLSNVGDVILTFPVIDLLKENFMDAELSVVVGPKAQPLFKNNPYITNVGIFHKKESLGNRLKWLQQLRKEKFDLVVDLRNTAIPFLISAKYRTPLSFGRTPPVHMKLKHLNRLKTVLNIPTNGESKHRYAMSIDSNDKKYAEGIIKNQIGPGLFVMVGPGAANHIKRWKDDGFAYVCDKLIRELKMKVVFVGDQSDEETVARILKEMKGKALNFCGKTSLTELAALMRHARLVIANDSAIMHMASYLDVPILAVFGPTDPVKYGPWSSQSFIAKSDAFCTACQEPNCRFSHECMDFLEADKVFAVAQSALKAGV